MRLASQTRAPMCNDRLVLALAKRYPTPSAESALDTSEIEPTPRYKNKCKQTFLIITLFFCFRVASDWCFSGNDRSKLPAQDHRVCYFAQDGLFLQRLQSFVACPPFQQKSKVSLGLFIYLFVYSLINTSGSPMRLPWSWDSIPEYI